MIAGTYVDPADYYEAAAEYCARNGMDGGAFTVMALRATIQYLPESVWQDIECNPHEFQRRIGEYAYGMAMENID